MGFITKLVTLTVELEVEIETKDRQVCNVMIGNPQDINDAIAEIVERDWQGKLDYELYRKNKSALDGHDTTRALMQ